MEWIAHLLKGFEEFQTNDFYELGLICVAFKDGIYIRLLKNNESGNEISLENFIQFYLLDYRC